MRSSVPASELPAPASPSEGWRFADLSRGRPAILLLFGFSLLLYISTTGYDFVGDDQVLLVTNPYVRSFHFWRQILAGNFWSFLGARGESPFYRPLVMLTLLVERAAFGLRPAGFHLVNALLNALVVLLVYGVGKRLWPEGRGPLWAGLFFAALPVHTENVAPVSGISDLECAVFLLLAVLIYVRPLDPQSRMERPAAWLAATMFLLAAFCKEVALAAPLLAVFYEHLLRPGRAASSKERLGRYAPMLLLTALYLAIRLAVVGGIERVSAGRSVGVKAGLRSVLSQLGNYAYKLVWPQHLTYSWTLHAPDSWSDPSVLFGALVVGLALWASVRFWRRNRAVAFAVLWFFSTLGPALNLGGFGVSAYGERYLYIPSVALCWLAGEGLSAGAALGRGQAERRWKFVPALAGLLLVVATVRTLARLPAWKDNFTLAQATLRDDPNVATYHLYLGNIYRGRGERNLARIEYVQAVALDPSIAQAYLNLAAVLWDDGAANAARVFLERTVEVDPRLAEGYYESGRVELWQHHRERARELFRRAVALDPNYFDALYTLGAMSLEEGGLEEAQELLTRAVRSNPASVAAHLALGEALTRRNKFLPAEAEFRRALELAPGSEPLFLSLAALLEQEGKQADALETYRLALRDQPHSANARFRFGVLALKMGRIAEATQALEDVLAVQPDSSLVHTQLGLAYEAAGKSSAARREFETALRLAPESEAAKVALQKLK